MLLLDAGDIAGGTSGDFARIKLDLYSKALSYMAYDVVGLGEWEVIYMSENGESHPYGDSIPTICANVVDSSTGELVAKSPYIIKKLPSGLKVGVISVLGEDRIDSVTQEKWQLRILPPAEAIKRHLGDLKKRSDLVVLISHTQIDMAKKLGADVPGLDAVIGGHLSATNPDFPEQAGTALFMQARSVGKYVGKLVLDIGADRKVASFAGEYVPMGTDYADDPEMAKLVTKHDQDVAAYYNQMSPHPAANTGPQPFVASMKCRECHAKEFVAWSKTKHARAFDVLRKDKRTADAECLKCHTTGFKEKGGFVSEVQTPLFKGVQCESCHGPGVMHVRRPAKGYGTVSESTCKRCHDQPNSPGFKYKEYRSKIIHLPEGTGSTSSAK